MNIEGTIEKIIAYAVHIVEPEEVILFGSMVNGTANVHSDVDLLIISESGIQKKEAVTRVKEYCHQHSLKCDVLIYSNAEFKKEINTPNSFVKAAQKYGESMYKKTGI